MENIFNFHIRYAKAILQQDDVIILASKEHYDKYVSALGEHHVVQTDMQDIWMRDFTTLNAANPIIMRYTAEGQGGGRKGQIEADFVQDKFGQLLEAAGLSYTSTNLLNDGGNYVDDYAGQAVISRKFLRDNKLDEAQGRRAVQGLTGVENIAFIEADEQGGLEHADGVVAFIDENTLVINAYPEDPSYSESLKADLKRGLPQVTIYELVTPYDGDTVYDPRFGSACGLYTNMLVTPHRIYLPQFGIPEDAQALDSLRRWTTKDVIPVLSDRICQMGGGVRCMSWQLRGTDAETLSQYLRNQ